MAAGYMGRVLPVGDPAVGVVKQNSSPTYLTYSLIHSTIVECILRLSMCCMTHMTKRAHNFCPAVVAPSSSQRQVLCLRI